MKYWNKYPGDAVAFPLEFFDYSGFLINLGEKNPIDETPLELGPPSRSIPERIFMTVWLMLLGDAELQININP